jgi:CBS domain containing-hemolysin-like protein
MARSNLWSEAEQVSVTQPRLPTRSSTQQGGFEVVDLDGRRIDKVLASRIETQEAA